MVSTIIFNFILGPIFMLVYATICRCLYAKDYSKELNYEYRKAHIPFIFYILSLIGLAIPYFNIAMVFILLFILLAIMDINGLIFSFIDLTGITVYRNYEHDKLKKDPIYIQRVEQFKKDHSFFIICKKILLKTKTLLFHNINK